jgi:kynurenine formamidase
MPQDLGQGTGIDVRAYLEELSNWGRWGEDDQRGTLNLIGPDQLRKAFELAREGKVISCSRVVDYAPKAALSEAPIPPLHFMTRSGESAKEGEGSSHDWVGMPVHGLHITHLDAHSHVFYDSEMYNGQNAGQVSTATGARRGNVDVAHDGIVGRGLLFDVPLLRGVEWLEETDSVTAADLDQLEEMHGMRAESGDIALIRTGYDRKRRESPDSAGHWNAHPRGAGLNVDTLPWMHRRDIAAIVTDCGTDAFPSGVPGMGSPVHTVAIVAMGMWIIDNGDLEALAAACAESKRREFLFTAAPLRLKNATGSPINPLAIL